VASLVLTSCGIDREGSGIEERKERERERERARREAHWGSNQVRETIRAFLVVGTAM
jgi:hypothetical protein